MMAEWIFRMWTGVGPKRIWGKGRKDKGPGYLQVSSGVLLKRSGQEQAGTDSESRNFKVEFARVCPKLAENKLMTAFVV
jgi:hypothetical protein